MMTFLKANAAGKTEQDKTTKTAEAPSAVLHHLLLSKGNHCLLAITHVSAVSEFLQKTKSNYAIFNGWIFLLKLFLRAIFAV